MARAVKIYGDAAQGSLFFDGLTIPPAPLGGVVEASAHPTLTNRIRVVRNDQFQKDGVTARILFKRMRHTRVRNKANQRLVQDLGYTAAQVIDYINDEANRKANEVDFQKNGTLVGSGNTLNFTGGIENVSVSSDVSTIKIAQVGISSTSGYVGTGVTLFHFKGSGVSTVTSVVGGATTIFFEGGGSSGNPVSSGSVTGAGNTTLRLTLQDATNVDIDVTNLRTTTSIGSSTDYFYLNNGAQLSSNTHDHAAGVAFYNQKIREGEELVFSTPGNDLHVGIWNGGVGVTSESNVTNKSNWSVKWEYNHSATDWEAANTATGPTGVEFNRDIVANNGTYAIRLDHSTQKLQLWQISTAYDWLLSQSSSGIGTTESYIYFASGDGTGGNSLPSVSEIRSQDFSVVSYDTSDRHGPSFFDGTKTDDVWKSNRSLRPGLKVNFTVPTSAGNQYWATNFEGTRDLGSGQNNAYTSGEMTWRLTVNEKFVAHTDCSFNTNYTAIDPGDSTITLAMPGRNISWRYNSDNTWDLFDEDTDEVILTGDDSLDGNDMYPYLLAVNNTTQPLQDYVQYEWDWNQKAWFIEHRDWSSGHNSNVALTIRNNAMPMKTGANSLEQSDGYHVITNAAVNVTWGEKLRPGQELKLSMLSQTSANASRNNMIIGVLNSTYSSYDHGFRFHSNGALKTQSEQDAGVTVQAGITTTCAGASLRLKYDYGDNKLKLDAVRSGVRETLAVSDSALDGSPIYISLGGNSTRLPTTTGVEYYGWETVHEGVGHYNPWGNWRIGGFPENTSLSVGIASTGNVLAYKADQVWRHKDGLAPGYKMHWLLPTTQINGQLGQWASSNASSGLTNVENNDTYWDWSWQTNTSEEIDALKGFTYNTSNSNYSATKWTDPNPGSTKFSVRYHGNNTIDLYDESNGAIIATKDVNGDGNPIYISWAAGGNTTTQAQMQDDFFGGGDVGIALTSASV